MNKEILKLNDIHKSFVSNGETIEVLKGIDLSVNEGEFVTLLGSSGCGKTTTLRIIGGLEHPTSGQVYLNGEAITDQPPEKRNVNTIFQNYALFPNMTVAENVGYGLKLKKMPKSEIKKKVEEMLHLVQLPDYGKRKPNELSGGQRQRVAIARAIVNEPKVLLLDEPLGALDLKLRRQMQLELKRMQKMIGISFIYITHDQDEAINMSDRIAVMHDGVLEQMGTPNEIYYQPKTSYVASFVGSTNVLHKDGKTYAIRSENVLFEDEMNGGLSARVVEKSFAGGQLSVLFVLKDGQQITASRSGIDVPLTVGNQVNLAWKPEAQIEVIDNGL